MFGNKKLTQSVTFSEDAADQALLEAIEKELTLAKYQTFSNLCKQALWQFLSLSQSTSATPSSSPQAASPQASGQLQKQMASLSAHLTQVEQKVLAQESSGFERLDRQLTQLAQQVAQLQVAVSFKATPVIPETPAPLPQPQPPQQKESDNQPRHEVERVQQLQEYDTSVQESDPVLQRLSSLLDDF